MTGIRKSMCFCRERDGFGTGIHDREAGEFEVVQFAEYVPNSGPTEVRIARYMTYDHWIAPPPGSFFSHTHSRNVQRIQTTGSKFWDAQAYGQLQGTWEWTFPFSYDYVEPLLFVFEDLVYSTKDIDEEMLEAMAYRFQKANNMRVPSFTVKIVTDHKMIGSTGCEELVLKGCVVQSFQISKSNTVSPINITMSGFYASEDLTYSASVPKTVYMDPVSRWARTAEWMGLYRETLGTAKYMANVESLTLQLSNSADRVFSVCSPFAANYYEGTTQISFTAGMWYTDPMQYRTLLMAQNGNIFVPRAKGDCIVDEFDLVTTTLQDLPVPGIFDDEAFSPTHKVAPKYVRNNVERFVQESALDETSDMFLYIRLMKAALKSYVADKGDGTALKDNMNSVDCQKMTLDVPLIRPSSYSRSPMKINATLWAKHYGHRMSSSGTPQTEGYTEIWGAQSYGDDPQDWQPRGSVIVDLLSCRRYIDDSDVEWIARLDPWFSHFEVFGDYIVNVYTRVYHINEETGQGSYSYTYGTPVVDEFMPGIALNPHAVDRGTFVPDNPWKDVSAGDLAAYKQSHIWTFSEYESAHNDSHVLGGDAS